MNKPKLFVSYSWTNSDHADRVLKLATELRENGIDAILDKWDLKEGQDSVAFMEQVVTNDEIQKVIMVCDQSYQIKADNRSGGVGTETQIISSSLYGNTDQEKFVAVIFERNDDGSACVPTYYSSRIYIDLSDSSTYAEEFDRLLRWAFDKPLHIKPELGERPSFLTDKSRTVYLRTATLFRRASDAIKRNKEFSDGAISDYFELYVVEFEKLRLTSNEIDGGGINESIETFLPYRNEIIQLIELIANYRDGIESHRALHRFFEQLLPYLEIQEIGSHHIWACDNYRIIVHELFLYTIAILIRNERFESAAYLLLNDYFFPGQSRFGRDVMVPFSFFRQPVESLHSNNRESKSRLLSPEGSLLKKRCSGLRIQLRDLVQADFILFINAKLHPRSNCYPWWPATALFASHNSGPLEVFARARSVKYFDRMKVILGVTKITQIESLLKQFQEPGGSPLTWEHHSVSPSQLIGINDIRTKP